MILDVANEESTSPGAGPPLPPGTKDADEEVAPEVAEERSTSPGAGPPSPPGTKDAGKGVALPGTHGVALSSSTDMPSKASRSMCTRVGGVNVTDTPEGGDAGLAFTISNNFDGSIYAGAVAAGVVDDKAVLAKPASASTVVLISCSDVAGEVALSSAKGTAASRSSASALSIAKMILLRAPGVEALNAATRSGQLSPAKLRTIASPAAELDMAGRSRSRWVLKAKGAQRSRAINCGWIARTMSLRATRCSTQHNSKNT
ncbi:unnamed protein product [Symbiodinium natans]|uniref:Uncharacterized protein n=1 Tax=Symbiodinium natans TaxID=878477 RepID=A0A812RJ61_9DINO|nr:unnamed protein product [Symbiodinium natans]